MKPSMKQQVKKMQTWQHGDICKDSCLIPGLLREQPRFGTKYDDKVQHSSISTFRVNVMTDML